MANMGYHSVMQLEDSEQLEQLLRSSKQLLQDDLGNQQLVNQALHGSQHRPAGMTQVLQVDCADDVHETSMQDQLQAALEDDLTELTASNWAQHSQSNQQYSNSRHNSSGVLFLAGQGPVSQSYAVSSASTDGESSNSSKHLGFFQYRKKDVSTAADTGAALDAVGAAQGVSTTRLKTAGPVLSSPVPQPVLTHGLPGQSANITHVTRPRTASGGMEQQQQWLAFQQDVPDVAVALPSAASFTRSASSPEPALRELLLPELLQSAAGMQSSAGIVEPAGSSSRKSTLHALQARLHAVPASSRSAVGVGDSAFLPAPVQGVSGRPQLLGRFDAAGTFARPAQGQLTGASAGMRQAVARLSLDGTGPQLGNSSRGIPPRLSLDRLPHNPVGNSNSSSSSMGTGMIRSSSGLLSRVANQPDWLEFAPDGPEDDIPVTNPSAGGSVPLPALGAYSPQDVLLLRQQARQQQQRQQQQQQQQELGDLLQRPASSPPFLTAEQQQQLWQAPGSHMVQQSSPVVASGAATGHDRPRSPAPSQSSPGYPPHSLSPAPLSPEAAAAAAAAAASIQQAMAAVNEEMEQLQVLQQLNQERRRLQAVARVAVARAAAAAAAASVADSGRPGGSILAAPSPSVEARGRQGSWESSAGSSAGANSSSTHTNSGGFSSGSLGAEGPSFGAPLLKYLGAAVQQGPLAAQQQQQQEQDPYGLLAQQQQQLYLQDGSRNMPHNRQMGNAAAAAGSSAALPPVSLPALQRPRYSETGAGSSTRAWDSVLGSASTAVMQRAGSLSPRALWSDVQGAPGSAVDPVLAGGAAMSSEAYGAAGSGARPRQGHVRRATWSDLPSYFELQPPVLQQQQQQQYTQPNNQYQAQQQQQQQQERQRQYDQLAASHQVRDHIDMGWLNEGAAGAAGGRASATGTRAGHGYVQGSTGAGAGQGYVQGSIARAGEGSGQAYVQGSTGTGHGYVEGSVEEELRQLEVDASQLLQLQQALRSLKRV